MIMFACLQHMYNAAAFKARTKALSKVRDKRAVAVHMSYSWPVMLLVSRVGWGTDAGKSSQPAKSSTQGLFSEPLLFVLLQNFQIKNARFNVGVGGVCDGSSYFILY